MPNEWLCTLRAQVEAAALHFPLPIHFHGELLPREDFLEGAHRVEEWNGCRIGIFRGSYDLVNEPRINFHGVKVACRLPSVKERSEERRVGKGWVSTCRSRGSPYHETKKKQRRKRVANNIG